MSKLLAIKLLKKENENRRIHVRYKERRKQGGFRISPAEALLYLNSGVATAKVSAKLDRVVDLRLTMALSKAAYIITQLYRSGKSGIVAEDCRTHQREGLSFSLNMAHSRAYINPTHKDYESFIAEIKSRE